MFKYAQLPSRSDSALQPQIPQTAQQESNSKGGMMVFKLSNMQVIK